MAGYKTTDAPEVCDTTGKIKLFNMNAVLDSSELELVLSTTATFTSRVELMQSINKNNKFHAWRFSGDQSGMGKIDTQMMDGSKRAGGPYFMHKWDGKKAGFGLPCNVKSSDVPTFDVPVIPIVSAVNASHFEL